MPDLTMNTASLVPSPVQPFKFPAIPHEFKVVALRECPTPDDLAICNTPDEAAAYWRMHVAIHPYFNPECECLVVLVLNTRRRVKGHYLVSIGTMDTILVHPREVFRLALMTSAAAIVPMHNLCASTHKLCYVAHRVMCSARLAGLALHRLSVREECCGCG
jgi:hypothetical protein